MPHELRRLNRRFDRLRKHINDDLPSSITPENKNQIIATLIMHFGSCNPDVQDRISDLINELQKI